MNVEQQLYTKYQPFGIISGEEIVLPLKYAEQWIDSCEETDLAIIGIDGFTVLNGMLHPEQEVIADFSSIQEINWNKYRQRCNQAARLFLSNFYHQNALSFSFTVVNHEEWQQSMRSREPILEQVE